MSIAISHSVTAAYTPLATTQHSPADGNTITSSTASASAGPAATLDLSGVAVAGQSLTLTQGQWLSLGTLNGKPFNVHPLANGEMEWTGGRQIQAPAPYSKLTPEQLRLGDAGAAYTRSETVYSQRIVGTVSALYAVASGKISTDLFNGWAQHGGPGESPNASPADIRDATSRLGINMDQPFSVNGKKLQFVDGNLVAA